MTKGVALERYSGPMEKMRHTVLRALWVCTYVIILQVFQLIQRLESQNDRLSDSRVD